VVRGRAAAAPDQVHPAVLRELADQARRRLGRLVVAAERVGETRVRVAAHRDRADARELLEVGSHLGRAERAVQADAERPGVLDREPERIEGLTRQRASRAVDDRSGDAEREPDAPLLEDLLDGDDRRLGVQRVEDGPDQQELDAPADQAAPLLAVGGPHLVEADRPVGRIVHVGREGQGLVEGSERPGREARPLLRGPLLGCPAGDLGGGPVHLVGEVLEPVVRLRDRAGREGVRRDDVRPGLEIGPMDVEHELRPGQRDDVVVPLQVPRVVGEPTAAEVRLLQTGLLDRRPLGALEDEDPLRDELPEPLEGASLPGGVHLGDSSACRRAEVGARSVASPPAGWTGPSVRATGPGARV
jgi:hypothetical protein